MQQEPFIEQAGPSAQSVHQAETSRQQAPTQKPTNSQTRRSERKRKNASPSKEQPDKSRTGHYSSNKNQRKWH